MTLTQARWRNWYVANRPRLLAYYAARRQAQRAEDAVMRARGWRERGGLWVPARKGVRA